MRRGQGVTPWLLDLKYHPDGGYVFRKTRYKDLSVMPDKQLLHLVFGGELVRPDTDQFVDPSKLHIVGIFPGYDEAYKAWRGATGATIDDAHTRYFIVHLHRFLDPTSDGHKHD